MFHPALSNVLFGMIALSQASNNLPVKPDISMSDKSKIIKLQQESNKNFLGITDFQQFLWLQQWQEQHKEYAFDFTPVCKWVAVSNAEHARPAAMNHLFLSGISFKINNPGLLNDPYAVELAAISAMINAYSNRLKKDQSIKTPNMDRLVQIQAQGRLEEAVIELRKIYTH
jgi:hypothetical protein